MKSRGGGLYGADSDAPTIDNKDRSATVLLALKAVSHFVVLIELVLF